MNDVIINLLSSLQKIPSVRKVLDSDRSGLTVANTALANDSILINGKFNLQEKITSKHTSQNRDVNLQKFIEFVDDISAHIVRLNHIGVSYWCANANEESDKYVALTKDSGVKVYEEPSDEKNTRWLFLGDALEWQQPLLEIVLVETKNSYEDIWIPHFQIDLDTVLSYEELKIYTDKHLGKGFFTWNIDVPDYGVCLGMGLLGIVNGTKIYLGLGTKLRGTEYHRKQMLKLLSAS